MVPTNAACRAKSDASEGAEFVAAAVRQLAGSNRVGRATSVQNWARQNPPFLRLKRDERAQQFAFRPHDAKFLRVDLDALGERAKVIAASRPHSAYYA